jgi:Protein of unknown function (DUF1007)
MWSRSRARRRDPGVPFLVILLVGGAGGAQAHPHALVVYSIVLSLPPDGVDRIGFVFTFDPLFSAIILRNAGEGDPDDVLRNHEGLSASLSLTSHRAGRPHLDQKGPGILSSFMPGPGGPQPRGFRRPTGLPARVPGVPQPCSGVLNSPHRGKGSCPL